MAGTPSEEEPTLNNHLSRTQPCQVKDLLASFKGLFSTTPGHTERVQCVIETPLGLVCHTALRPLPKSHWEAFDKEVKDMLCLGVIEPSTSFMPVYLDGIVIYSRTWEDHLKHLQQVFQQLHTAGLWVNHKKSKGGFTEQKYLGYTVGGGQPKPQKKKVETIPTATRPHTKK